MRRIVDSENQDQVLSEWRGAAAQIWTYNVSLKRMAIRVYRPREPNEMYVRAGGCEYIVGPFSWENSDIQIVNDLTELISCRIIDEKVGFELRCGAASILLGPATAPDEIFDSSSDS
jgi:hypothetical protein